MGQRALSRFFAPVCFLRPFVPRDVLLMVFQWGRSEGEEFYPVQGDCVFPGLVGQDVYARVPWHCAKVHVARYGGGREWLVEG